ncbi:MAG: EAL domain-containing protein, partial [Deltaproteobacteria bacterium]|nr:EAL domain-containing protein [Deltaproteobacteria bacterium]
MELTPLREAAPVDSTRGVQRNDLDVHFQPIVDLATRTIFAYEALTRCRWPAFSDPSRLFALASQEGACGRLGRLVCEITFERAPGVPLFVNVHPDEFAARWLVRPDDPLFVHDEQVFVEITESAAFTHHDLCRSVLRELSTRGGALLAVDDLGAGHSNLKRVLDLEPQVVKLDRALVTGLDRHPRQ